MTTMLERSEDMVGKQMRGRYTQKPKLEVDRQAVGAALWAELDRTMP